MPPKKNPLRLNGLQRRTLAVLQELAEMPDAASLHADTGEAEISWFPQAHGDHIHLGGGTVLLKDATGITNEGVWRALERKGLAKSQYPRAIRITPAGLAYDTGVRDAIVHRHEQDEPA